MSMSYLLQDDYEYIYIYIHTYWTNSTHKHEIRHPIFPWPQYAAIKALRRLRFSRFSLMLFTMHIYLGPPNTTQENG